MFCRIDDKFIVKAKNFSDALTKINQIGYSFKYYNCKQKRINKKDIIRYLNFDNMIFLSEDIIKHEMPCFHSWYKTKEKSYAMINNFIKF